MLDDVKCTHCHTFDQITAVVALRIDQSQLTQAKVEHCARNGADILLQKWLDEDDAWQGRMTQACRVVSAIFRNGFMEEPMVRQRPAMSYGMQMRSLKSLTDGRGGEHDHEWPPKHLPSLGPDS